MGRPQSTTTFTYAQYRDARTADTPPQIGDIVRGRSLPGPGLSQCFTAQVSAVDAGRGIVTVTKPRDRNRFEFCLEGRPQEVMACQLALLERQL
jgi:hypothetical protein